jgi:peroxiredoxin family protein
MEEQDKPLSLVLFSGTDDKLNAAAVLTVGAAAMGRRVNIFLQYYALDAFRASRITQDRQLSAEATAELAGEIRSHPGNHWSELLRQAKDIGEVDIQACALSMEMFHLAKDELDQLVDGVEGVAAFMTSAEEGQVVFI